MKMNDMKIKSSKSELLALLSEQADNEISELDLEDKLADLGVDSMAFVMLVHEIEEKYSIEIDSSELDSLSGDVRVRDVVNLLNSKGIQIEDV
jgi:acyl carrier protein